MTRAKKCCYLCGEITHTMETKHTLPEAFKVKTPADANAGFWNPDKMMGWADGYNACLERTAAKELLKAASIALAEIEMKNAHFGMRTSTATEALRAALSKATK